MRISVAAAHLKQGQLEISLDIAVGLVEDVTDVNRPVAAPAANATLDVVLHRPPPLDQQSLEISRPLGALGHVRLLNLTAWRKKPRTSVLSGTPGPLASTFGRLAQRWRSVRAGPPLAQPPGSCYSSLDGSLNRGPESGRVSARRRQHAARQRSRRGRPHALPRATRSAPSAQQRYWAIFEELRAELGYADYLGALQRYRVEHPRDPQPARAVVLPRELPVREPALPGSLDVIEHLAQWGPTVILSDGDVVFQPRKVERSGLFEAVERHVLIYIHKELELDDVERRYPAEHYVLVDDKLRILAAVKKVWGERVTTVFPRQGHYAHDPEGRDATRAPT